ncbi:F0F1 ATP synthase subunit delta [Kutzneria viridogrisea]|uniref:ATP synthase subunit delta n=1 Tax=Kutzneria viridogrisea TaxID=47990 RepID=A0ABR6BHA7_9PSEU|nr:F-type H+-transporting ATPase subunit delta [Kutzneria viridogrisea]
MTLHALHAASRDALAAAELRLLDVVDGVDPDGLTALGDELFSVVGLLAGEHGLRRVVADASSDPAGREALVRGLLAGKVGEPTLQVLAAAVTARWSSARELLDGLESLARTALLVRAERENRLDAVEDELFRFGRILAGQPELERLLSARDGASEAKLGLVDTLVSGKVEPVTKQLVEQLVVLPRGRRLVAGLEELAAAAAKRRERSVAYVRTASPLTEQQYERLAATLTRVYSRPIVLHVEIDPDLGGGLVIRVGDEVIDGSAAGRLEALRRQLAA